SALAEVVQRADDARLRELALTQITDERALSDLARRGPDSTIRRAALERLDDPDLLRAIAVDESRKPLGIAAVERISDLDALEQVASKAKNKHVRSRAHKRKSELSEAERPQVSSAEKRAHAERVQLVRQVKKLVNTKEWTQSYTEVERAKERWAELEGGHDPELENKFERHVERYTQRYQTVGVKVLEAARKKQEEARRSVEEPARAEVSAPAPSEPSEDEEPQVMVGGETTVDEQADEDARAAAREQRMLVNIARLEALCIELEELETIDRYKVADRKLSQAAKTFASLRLPAGDKREELTERYEEARKKAIIRSKELREADEWKRWSVLPKLEALIKEAQALLEREDIGRLGRELKVLQRQWKEAGPAPHSKNQELWEKFKDTCDQVYERVKDHRKVAAEEQKQNLEKKLALCEQVEELAESTDWDETAEAIKSLQAEWKSIGPVPRKKSKQIWQRFRGACDRFFERRKPVLEERLEELRENLDAKQALLAEIEALASDERDWDEVRDALGELKSRWRGIGHVPRKDYGALTERYRTATDQVFARREQAAQAKLEDSRREVEELIAKLDTAMQQAGVDAGWDDEDVAEKGDEQQMVRFACELRAAVLELGAQAGELRERTRALIRAALEASPEAFDGSELDPQTSRRRRRRLIDRLEDLLPKDDGPKLDELSAEEVAAKLREALAANALGIVSEDPRPVSEIVDEIRTSWSLIGPVPGRDGVELNDRFELARQRVLDAFPDEED
ncbi:MAG: DUF349 domain-containing protein, partial [Deltaproteobacteria bacterium]|nr:DUF349 domain-containing protein [Deltaproteobacteria bacterium]